MKNKTVNKKIQKAFNSIAPDNFNTVLSKINYEEKDVIKMTVTKNHTFRKFTAVAATLAILLCGAALIATSVSNTVTAVYLDVNPGINLQVDKNNIVKEINALNEDARIVLADKNLKNATLDNCVDTIINSMVEEGYLNQNKNSLLVSVDGKNSSAIQGKIENRVADTLSDENFKVAVVNCNIESDSSVQALSEKHGISPGKAQFVINLSKNLNHTADELAQLSVNELNILADENGLKLSQEKPGKGEYITAEKAFNISYEKSGISPAQSSISGSMEYLNGKMIYETFLYGNGYRCITEIDAVTGEVLGFFKEEFNADTVLTSTPAIENN